MSQSNAEQLFQEVALAHSVEEAARRTSIGRTAIYSEIKEGRLKARKAGKRTLITDADLRAWLDSLPLMHSAA